MSENNKEEKKLSDFIRRIADQGIKSTLLNEENLREVLKEVPLPKAVVSSILGQIKNSRDDIIALVREEIKKYLQSLNTNKMIDYVLKNYEIDVQASLKFKKKTQESTTEASKKSKENG